MPKIVSATAARRQMAPAPAQTPAGARCEQRVPARPQMASRCRALAAINRADEAANGCRVGGRSLQESGPARPKIVGGGGFSLRTTVRRENTRLCVRKLRPRRRLFVANNPADEAANGGCTHGHLLRTTAPTSPQMAATPADIFCEQLRRRGSKWRRAVGPLAASNDAGEAANSGRAGGRHKWRPRRPALTANNRACEAVSGTPRHPIPPTTIPPHQPSTLLQQTNQPTRITSSTPTSPPLQPTSLPTTPHHHHSTPPPHLRQTTPIHHHHSHPLHPTVYLPF